jgi:hypothetical protein
MSDLYARAEAEAEVQRLCAAVERDLLALAAV